MDYNQLFSSIPSLWASEVSIVHPKIRPLGEGVCKFSENYYVIYWVKLCHNVNNDVSGGHLRSKSGQIEIASEI